jgi:hypothetical protein
MVGRTRCCLGTAVIVVLFGCLIPTVERRCCRHGRRCLGDASFRVGVKLFVFHTLADSAHALAPAFALLPQGTTLTGGGSLENVGGHALGSGVHQAVETDADSVETVRLANAVQAPLGVASASGKHLHTYNIRIINYKCQHSILLMNMYNNYLT